MNRHRSISTYALTVMVTLAFYLVPLGIMAAAVQLGLHADPPTRSQASATTRGAHPGDTLGAEVRLADPILLLVGDDNGDGVIDEDESGWDCTTMGNLICGPVIA
ncbi:hypothetical protein [Gordonia sp. NB41Y]|uniref:hypothetical protein n=1 Tax=Gordonia sp. NB41Y TaxID=875808 RepID=UPI0002BFFC60|nr:hypothetical protein [Gordonia sp. NB41Y]EMP13510.1 hypothetical protein ISGA_339 [Gordonia sp. NB41Y]WLP91452.1 hypothetical protein Q9K23_04080 [Gordonia sp. NB41Y]